METLEEVKKYLNDKKIPFIAKDDYVTGGREGAGNGGKKISVEFTITQDGDGKISGNCLGLGKDLWNAPPKEVIDAYYNRTTVYAHELD